MCAEVSPKAESGMSCSGAFLAFVFRQFVVDDVERFSLDAVLNTNNFYGGDDPGCE